jgi:hypothetical protein
MGFGRNTNKFQSIFAKPKAPTKPDFYASQKVHKS